MDIINKLNDYLFHYRKFGKGGIKLYSNINNKKNNLFEVKIKDIAHPFYLRGGTSDIAVFYQIFSFKQYKIQYNFKPKYIFDLGANIGLASIYFKNIYRDATIIAVEPEQSNFELLLKNTSPYKNIHCFKGGIWDKSTQLEILDIGKGDWAFVTKEITNTSDNATPAITINYLMSQFKIPTIDILKVDIEGAEKEIFEGDHEKWLPYVKAMIIELHDRYKPGCSKSFFKAMIKYNFSTRFRGENIICDMIT